MSYDYYFFFALGSNWRYSASVRLWIGYATAQDKVVAKSSFSH